MPLSIGHHSITCVHRPCSAAACAGGGDDAVRAAVAAAGRRRHALPLPPQAGRLPRPRSGAQNTHGARRRRGRGRRPAAVVLLVEPGGC